MRRILPRLALAVALAVGLSGAKLLDGGPFVVVYDHMTETEAHDLFERPRRL